MKILFVMWPARRMVIDGSGGYFYPYRRVDQMSYMKHDTPTRPRGDQGSVRTDFSGSRWVEEEQFYI